MSDLERSLNSSSVAETLATYDKWAKNYNDDVDKEQYVAPQSASDYVVKYLGTRDIASVKILDAGCGTGLVGQHLAKRGAKQVQGIDLSPGMLEVARQTRVYQSLSVADLSQRLDLPDHSYDVVVCVGTMTQGHVGPEAFDELVRVVKTGGIIVSTVRESVWKKNGYEDKVKELAKQGKVKLLSDQIEMQRIGEGVQAIFVVLEVQ
ncbi:hypothetical protein FZEAL_6711 [Fusarium zealandicum]|uniref:Methyltransferase domain-containing protein n=1 Tax=Fusarium zealandicum TaxID=1053134 RepID=A0A8H4XJ72_9HYPO|nr:hypothetical protein FZEAL_6711 [Fusarium zealandicum]